LDNAVDEALAGRNDRIEVTLHPDHSVTVQDWGSGIPVDVMPEQGLPALTVVLTKLHAGGKFGGEGYKVSGGLHGVGVSVVNALSERLIAEVRRGGKIYRQEFVRGVPAADMETVGTTAKNDTVHKSIVYFEGENEQGNVEVAMQWNASYQDSVYTFANNINTHEGGTHLSGFKAALTGTLNRYARQFNLLNEKDENLDGEDVREGLAAVISVKLRDPQF